jgi:RimJ/RimL family protein N-acetyltransferase
VAHPDLQLHGDLVVLRSTSEEDLPSLVALWNDGDVMRWVGFPQGLGYDDGKAAKWLAAVRGHPDRFHFSAYGRDVGFCGEVYCAVDRVHRRAGLDIKFVQGARGGGRSRDALLTLIDWVFAEIEDADAVWTEPSEENLAARTLYYSCGLRARERPPDMEPYPSYWELSREEWERRGTLPSRRPRRGSFPGPGTRTSEAVE